MLLQIMICAVLCFSTYIFFVALHNHRFFEIISEEKSLFELPPLSVLIPARNEERNIGKLLDSLVKQKYPNLEIIVLNDQSTDNTESICLDWTSKSTLVRYENGTNVPPSWIGKNWACHQLSQLAQSDFILFLDADVELNPNFLRTLMTKCVSNDYQFITVWPHQMFAGKIDKMAIQQVYFGLFSLLPIFWFTKHPNAGYPEFWKKINNSMAAACGQCLLFSTELYMAIGGHQAAKSEIVEDVFLAKLVKAHRAKIGSFVGRNLISTKMYASPQTTFEGFRKNFFAGFSYNLTLFLAMGLLQLLTVFLPIIVLFMSVIPQFPFSLDTIIIASLAVLMFWSARLLAHQKFGFRLSEIVLQIPAIFWFWNLALFSVSDFILHRPTSWKSRSITIQPKIQSNGNNCGEK